MTKYIAVFANGAEIVRTSANGLKNRLDFYNWIIEQGLGKKNGKVVKIICKPYI